MSATKHSPEPWSAMVNGDGPHAIRSSLRPLRESVVVGCLSGLTSADDARRIVAAVNACAGIPTEALEAGHLKGALDALLKYQRENRLSHDADAERLEAAGPHLGALGLRRWDP